MKSTQLISYLVILSIAAIGGCTSNEIAEYKNMRRKYPNESDKELFSLYKSNQRNPDKTRDISQSDVPNDI